MEKRREKRLDEENKVVLHVLPGNEQQEEESFYSFSRDISVGGLRLVTDSPLPVKTRVRLEIALAESQKLITGVAEVRWVKSLFDDDVFEMGLEFVELDPQSRVHLLEHVYRKVLSR